MRYKKIPYQLFVKNRQKLSEKLEPGSVALIYSNFQMPRNGDQYYPYRQHSDLFYLTGIDQEKSILMVEKKADQSSEETLFILKSTKELEIWEGHKLTQDEASEISGIKKICFLDNYDTLIRETILRNENIYLNVPENPKFKPEVSIRDIHVCRQLKRSYPLHRYKRLAPIMQQLRLIKEPEEIDLIKKACSITKEAFLHVLKTVTPGMKEYELEAEISRIFIKHGAKGHAYDPIVAGGKNACVLHYTENHSTCKSDELILMDFGAEYANYAADLSRTIPVNSHFTERQLQLYESTLRVFQFARSVMKPGTTINALHDEVCKYWQEEHVKLGLYTLKDVKKQDPKNPLWKKYYMHGTSHFLGLDVHDVGTKDIVFEPGMVLTCEPGIYLEHESTGIRLENDILITEDGPEDLMHDIPLSPQDIIDAMQ